ncbi:MAG: hypothetical protein LLF87_02350 [Eubacteriales bacterium]|nr:hypothetical protein [Eubacteriales bacterium]
MAEKKIAELLRETPPFDYISEKNKAFIAAFDEAMEARGYSAGGAIGNGYCWGRHMLIYVKAGAKSQKVTARVYLQEKGIVLRLFFSGVDKHRAYIEAAPEPIKAVFEKGFGDCNHCHNEKDGACRFRKSYTLNATPIDKCNGNTFWFFDPSLDLMPDYLKLYDTFYPFREKVSAV